MYAGAGGDVVENDRDMHRVGQGGIMAQQAVTVAFVIVGRDNEQRVGPGSLGGFAFSMAWTVSLVPVPAMTLQAPFAAVTQWAMRAVCSRSLIVAASPVVAQTATGADARLDLARQQGIK